MFLYFCSEIHNIKDMKQQQNKGNNILIFTKGERIAILILLSIIAFMLTLSVFPPRRQHTKASLVDTMYLDSLIACQVAGCREPGTKNDLPLRGENQSPVTKQYTSDHRRSTADHRRQTDEHERQTVDNKQHADHERQTTSPRFVTLDLNAADSTQLVDLPQIGEVMASRIQRYRERLGGFVDFEQLFEVKGMDTTRYETILPYLTLSHDKVRKLDINRSSFKELLRHPYLEYEQVKNIVQHRDRKGLVKDWEQVTTIVKDVNPRLKDYLEY